MSFFRFLKFISPLSLLLLLAAAVPAQNVSSPAPDIKATLRDINAANIERTIRKLVSFGTRNTLSSQTDPKRGIGAARDWIADEFRKIAATSDGRMTVSLQTFVQPVVPRVPRPTPLTNVVATLRGTRPDAETRILLVSGHYDSICSNPTDAESDAPGANDDASGVAAVLEMARVMAKHPLEKTVVFLAVAGEEQGLLGSTYFAEQARKQNLQIEAMLTNDIIGSSVGPDGKKDDRTVRLFAEGIPSDESSEAARTRRSVGGENDSPSRQLARYIRETAAKYVPAMRVTLVYRRDRYGRGGDHIPFNERGYAAVRFTEKSEDYRHQHQNVRTEKGVVYGDLPEFVDFAYIAKIARVNAAALLNLALAPAPPENVQLSNRLSPDTEIRWKASAESDLAAYEVVWRETTAPFWTHSRRVKPTATSLTLPNLSKDDYFFGVRAIDSQGHRSLVVFPTPAR